MKAYRVAYTEFSPNMDVKETNVEYYDSKEKVLLNHPDAIIFIYKYTEDGFKYCLNPTSNDGWLCEEIEIK